MYIGTTYLLLQKSLFERNNTYMNYTNSSFIKLHYVFWLKCVNQLPSIHVVVVGRGHEQAVKMNLEVSPNNRPGVLN